MRLESDFATRSTRRRLALVGVTLAAVLTVTVGASALRPADADAWAWKDNCTLIVSNKTGVQSAVRPILYAPALPTSTASLALYALRLANGTPTSGSDPYTNFGVPVPSWGCHTFMNFTSPGGTVSCTAEAPTKGANSFGCSGPAATTIIRDDDDIAGEIFIPSRSGASIPGSQGPKSQEPKISGDSVRAGALPGSGWRKSEDVTDFGLVGKLMATEELPRGCEKQGNEAAPDQVNTEEVVRAGGNEGVGAVVTTYDNAGQAKQTVQEALSDQSVGCLAKLLNSKDTKVAVTPLATTEANDQTGIEGNQLVISRSGDGGFRPVAYLNVSGWAEGNEAAIELYETVGAAPSEASEAEAAEAVRIGS